MKKILIMLSIMAVLLSSCDLFNAGIPESMEKKDTVATPTIKLGAGQEAGNFDFTQEIIFESETLDVRFYYTINGETPTAVSTTGSILRLPTTGSSYTVKVIAVKDGWLDSAVTSVVFTNTRVATPVISPTSGAVDFSKSITIEFTSTTKDVRFYYTLGSTEANTPMPTKDSDVAIDGSLKLPNLGNQTRYTIKVIGIKEGLLDSEVTSVVFMHRNTVATPLITSGSFASGAKDVSISCSTPNAKIYYTIDGTNPATSLSGSTQKYNTSISLSLASASVNVKAIAITEGMLDSDIASVFISKNMDSVLVESKDMSFPIGSSSTVTFTKNLYMGASEVTQGQYYDVMTTHGGLDDYTPDASDWYSRHGTSRPSLFTGTDGSNNWRDLPVEQVSWYDAVRFCNALSKAEGLDPYYTITGGNPSDEQNSPPLIQIADGTGIIGTSGVGPGVGYRLPTEAEWEYVAGGGSGTRTTYAGTNTAGTGSGELGDYAWYWDNKNNPSTPKAVKTKAPNALGMYDMSGNVGEWCWDWHGSTYPSDDTDPTGIDSDSNRIIRGGSCISEAAQADITYRNYTTPYNRYGFDVGFRVVRTVAP